MTYTEQQVAEIISNNLSLRRQVASLEESLKIALAEKEQAEEKYSLMCRRCLDVYMSPNEMDKTVSVRVKVPEFMDDNSFAHALTRRILNACLSERSNRFDIPV